MSRPMHPADLLAAAIDRAGSPVCVGLDPVLERVPPACNTPGQPAPDAIETFSLGVIDALPSTVPSIKVQVACYERYLEAGWRVLRRVVQHAIDRQLVVIFDAKRGDIGSTSEHYAAAARAIGAHAITVNGYLGPSGITPFLDAGLGVFVLVRTSNPDSDPLQATPGRDGRTVAQVVADQVRELGESRLGSRGLSSAGAVVGATKAADAAELRARMPDQVFLVPGYGAQGGTAADVRQMLRPEPASLGEAGVIVNASRSVIYPAAAKPGTSWQDAIRDAARAFADDVASACRTEP
ncbi:MAG: orotidine-5'-phosphate decarboxylase [Planctomycetota bacterium]|nr:orotidine-5'-phosphate decarboxylase [Planctomycetota bacterium]